MAARPWPARFSALFKTWKGFGRRIDDLQIRASYKNRHVELLRAIHPDSEYSAAARVYARSEIYKVEGGHQVKRDWLEEILN